MSPLHVACHAIVPFQYEICEIFKNTYFEEHLPINASVNERQQETHVLLCKKNESHLVNLLRGQ